MKLCWLTMTVLAVLISWNGTLRAQGRQPAQAPALNQPPAADPVVAEVKNSYNLYRNYLLKAAAKMPPEEYGFKPTPEMRSFGALVGHIADAQISFCSPVNGTARRGNAEAANKAKTELTFALQASFAECDAAFNALTDQSAAQVLAVGSSQRTRLGALLRALLHDEEEYGYLAVYLRLKGIVPPSSEKK